MMNNETSLNWTFYSNIKQFVEGLTSSGMMKWYAAILDCGHWHYSPDSWQPFPASKPVGAQVACKKCSHIAEEAARLEALDAKDFAYMRFDTRFAYPEQGIFGSYNVYRRDPSSPTGVLLLTSFIATKEIDAIIARKGLCTASPTEGRVR